MGTASSTSTNIIMIGTMCAILIAGAYYYLLTNDFYENDILPPIDSNAESFVCDQDGGIWIPETGSCFFDNHSSGGTVEMIESFDKSCSTDTIQEGHIYREEYSNGGFLEFCLSNEYQSSICLTVGGANGKCELLSGVTP